MDKICQSCRLVSNFKFCDLHKAFWRKFDHWQWKTKKAKLEFKPVPTINTKAALKRPSTLPTSSSPRKPPKVRVYQNDQLADFKEMDKITKFDDMTHSQAPANYPFHKTLECIVFYNLVFCATTGFPKIFGAIKVDQDLHVKLEWCWLGMPWMAFLKIAVVNHKFNSYLETLVWLVWDSVFNTIIFWVLRAGLCR